jgi:hypothetical protein
MRKMRKRSAWWRMPSPAMTVACIALAVSLSGVSYAAVVLPRNSVGTPQLKRNAVTSPKVKANALTGADINEARLGKVPNADRLDSLNSSAFLPARAVRFARVKSTGLLVSGTATSASRFSTGMYFVRFPTAINGCAAAVNSASFAGFDSSVYRVWAQVAIGYGSGGAVDPLSVIVSLFQNNGSSVDSSFTLVLACP